MFNVYKDNTSLQIAVFGCDGTGYGRSAGQARPAYADGVGMVRPVVLGDHLYFDDGDAIVKIDLVTVQRAVGIRDRDIVSVQELEPGVMVVGGGYRNR